MQKQEVLKNCGLCGEIITDKKSYRQVKSSENFCKIFSELNLKEDGYVCKFCVNKINRIVRLDDDIKTKVSKLSEKRNEIFADLQKTVSTCKKSCTPVNKKRERQKNTPTPRKPKVRRLLPFHNSPRAVRDCVPIKPFESAADSQDESASFANLLDGDSVRDLHTKIPEKDFDVKVIYNII